MTRDEYLNQHNVLVAAAQRALDDEDFDGAAARREDIKALENKFKRSVSEQKLLAEMAVVPDMSAYVDAPSTSSKDVDALDMTNSIDYRRAFKAHVQSGVPMPARFQNADANTLTSDVSSVIPTIVVNRIIEKMESIGMIISKVTRTSYKSGVGIATSTVKPVATWVAEGASSDKQKATTGNIIFTAHKLRCEISMSMEVATMSIDAFEDAFVTQVSRAMVRAIEARIMSKDTGTASVRGILAETPAAGQALTISEITYTELLRAEGALPQAYENAAVWCMSRATYNNFLGMTDAAGQPIARTNGGISGKPEHTLLGRRVEMCGDYLPNFVAAAQGDVFALLFDFNDYVLNTVYDMGVQRKQDWDTEDMRTKAVMSLDGKVVDVNSLVTLTKGETTP